MLFNVAQLLKAAVGTTRTYDLEEWLPKLDEQTSLVEPIHGTVKFTRTNRGILVDARLTTSAKLECSRCLDVYVEHLPINFCEEYIPVVDVETGHAVDIPHEIYAFLINEKHEIDLEPAVREYGVLALPMKPLCRAECAGLCPQCGANLNRERCTCVVDATDPRFAGLKAFLSSEESSN